MPTTDRSIQNPGASQVFLGYFLGILTASYTFVQMMGGKNAWNFTHEHIDFKAITLAIFFAICFSFLPCIGLHFIARRFRIRSVFFYLISGSALALLTGEILQQLMDLWNAMNMGSFSQKMSASMASNLKDLLIFLPTGAFPGLTYWAVAGRFYRSGP